MSWKDDLYDLDMRESEDLDVIANADTEAKTDDIGFINPTSGAGILARENGVLEGFSDYGLGFRFSSYSQSLSVFAPNIHLFTLGVQKHNTVVRNTFLKDEYGDIDHILQEYQSIDGVSINEKL